jgi:biopolymer transport protein ExbB/TolQ
MSTAMEWFGDGGPVTTLLLLVGLLGFAVIVERGYVIVVRSKNRGRIFLERIVQLVRADKVDEAIKQCASSSAALPDIGLVLLRSRSRDEGDLHNLADAALLTLLPRLTRRLQYLSALALIAVMLGVLGTLRAIEGGFTPAPSAPGIAPVLAPRALHPLELGIIIGVVLIAGRSYLVSQSEVIIEQIREFSARLINALIDRPDVRLGHR